MQSEQREAIFIRDGYQCRRCDQPATEIAHRIARTKGNAKEIQKLWLRWMQIYISLAGAYEILDEPENVVASCQKCNDYFNCGHNKQERLQILITIARRLYVAGEIRMQEVQQEDNR